METVAENTEVEKREEGFDVSALMGAKTLRVWVPFNSKIKVELNYVPRSELSEMRAACTKTTWDRKHQPVEDFDDQKFAEKLGQRAVNNWIGPEVNGQPLPATPENIKIFMQKWFDFAKFIADTSTDLETLVEAEKEAARKN